MKSDLSIKLMIVMIIICTTTTVEFSSDCVNMLLYINTVQ